MNTLGQANFNVLTYIQKVEISQTEEMTHCMKTRAAKPGDLSPGAHRMERELSPELCPLTPTCYLNCGISAPLLKNKCKKQRTNLRDI